MSTKKELIKAIKQYKKNNCPSTRGLNKDQLELIASKLKIGPYLGRRDVHEETTFPKEKMSLKAIQKLEEKKKVKQLENIKEYNKLELEKNKLFDKIAEINSSILSLSGIDREMATAESINLVNEAQKISDKQQKLNLPQDISLDITPQEGITPKKKVKSLLKDISKTKKEMKIKDTIFETKQMLNEFKINQSLSEIEKIIKSKKPNSNKVNELKNLITDVIVEVAKPKSKPIKNEVPKNEVPKNEVPKRSKKDEEEIKKLEDEMKRTLMEPNLIERTRKQMEIMKKLAQF